MSALAALTARPFTPMTELADKLPEGLRRPVLQMVAAKGAFVSVASLIMAATFLCVVILRYGFQADLFAYNEWLLIICFWLFFMGGARTILLGLPGRSSSAPRLWACSFHRALRRSSMPGSHSSQCSSAFCQP